MPQALIGTLAHAVLREDAGFHAYQILEAGARQFAVWATLMRAGIFCQTADIARRLFRGGELHQEAGVSWRCAIPSWRRIGSKGFGVAMGWSMDRQGIRTLFDHQSKRLKQFELSGPRRERVSLDNYTDELAARDAEFRDEARQMVRTSLKFRALRQPWPGLFSHLQFSSLAREPAWRRRMPPFVSALPPNSFCMRHLRLG